MAERQVSEPSGDEQSGARPAKLSRLAAILVGLVLVIVAANNQAVKLSDEFLPEIPARSVWGARLLLGLVGLLALLWGLGGVIGPPLVAVRRWWSRHRDRVKATGVEPAPADAPGLPARQATMGRDVELAALVDNLLAQPPRPTPILGPSGIGKTNLMVAALHKPTVAARYGIGRVFVRCEGSASAVATVTELAAVLGIPMATGDLRTDCLRYLGEAPAVVCLDNAETPWEADTLRTEDLFAQLASVAGLVVSLRGAERPGGLGWAPPLRLQPLDSQAAAALFLSIVPPGFDGPGLSELLDEMGGVPLAIELLAYAAEGEGLDSLGGRWRTERVKLLRSGTADHRLLSVASSVEASWTGPLMPEPARRLLSILGKLPNGIAHSDIEPLMPGDGPAAADVLRRRGLAFDEIGRLRTHPPVRQHVEAAHPPAGPDWERVTAHYQLLSMELGPRVGGPAGAEAVDRLAAEAANLTTAVLGSGHLVDAARGLDAIHALRDLARFTAVDLGLLFGSALHVAEAGQDDGRLARAQEDLADIALAHSDDEDARSRYEQAVRLYRQVGNILGEANCIRRLGDIALARSDHERGRARYEQALALYRQVGNVLGEAHCIKGVSDIALARSDYEGARALYEQALPLYRQVGNVLGEANCIKGLGDIALARSDHERGRARYEQARALYRQAGNVLGEANCILRLGDIALARSDHERAREHYKQALTLYRQVGNVLGEANYIERLGDVAMRRSDHKGAQEHYEQALALYRQVGNVLGEANCTERLGDIALRRSDHQAARERYEQALPLYRQVGNVLGEANCILRLGDIALARSDHQGARERYEQALPLYRQAGNILGEANCVKGLGDIALAGLDYERARARYEHALPLYRQAGNVLGEAHCINGLGDIALQRSDHEWARALYEEALALYQRVEEPYAVGVTHRQLARLSTDSQERQDHVAASRSAWTSIGRDHLIAELDREFPGTPPGRGGLRPGRRRPRVDR